MREDRVQIFSENALRSESDRWLWGWQCFACGEEDTGYGNASTAQEAADNHAAMPCRPAEVRK